ncbi:defensin BmKDfsin1-like isoform X2 [Dermacentor variabilis]|uniref:defensin BmKDfsin1-like isoform X2 n=1 Tax=Dermacentor variabilis TaxID=34621 RepID=UPI003F5C4F55
MSHLALAAALSALAAHLGSTSGPEIVNNDASHGCPHDPFECFVFCKSMEHEFFFCVGLRQHLCLCNTDTPVDDPR